MDKFMNDFKMVAKSALFNEAEVTKDALDETASQISFIDLDETPRWAVMDFALIRLKTILKIPLSEQDVLLLKEANKHLVKNQNESNSSFSTYKLESV